MAPLSVSSRTTPIQLCSEIPDITGYDENKENIPQYGFEVLVKTGRNSYHAVAVQDDNMMQVLKQISSPLASMRYSILRFPETGTPSLKLSILLKVMLWGYTQYISRIRATERLRECALSGTVDDYKSMRPYDGILSHGVSLYRLTADPQRRFMFSCTVNSSLLQDFE